jgi:hypothetical protein
VPASAMARWCRKRARFFLALLVLASLTCVNENAPDWLVKAAEETDAMVRKVMPIVRAAQETVDNARAALASAGLSPAARRDLDLALAMEAGLREFLGAARARRTASGSFAGIISGTGIVALASMAVVGVAEVGAATDTATVTVRDDARPT